MDDMPSAHRPGLRIDDRLTIPESELTWRFSRSSGPGGQGVNTADSRVELLWDVAESTTLSERQRERMLDRLRHRLVDGVLTVTASEHRAQLRNRDAARDRLAALVPEFYKPTADVQRFLDEAAAEGLDAVPFDKESEGLGTDRTVAVEGGGTTFRVIKSTNPPVLILDVLLLAVDQRPGVCGRGYGTRLTNYMKALVLKLAARANSGATRASRSTALAGSAPDAAACAFRPATTLSSPIVSAQNIGPPV